MLTTHLLETIQNQASFASFSDQEVSEEDLLTIAEAGRNSPTELYKEKRIFTIVKKREIIDRLIQELGQALNKDNYNFFNPAALLIISVPEDSPYSLFEIGSISQSIMLASSALGVGAIWSGQIPYFSDRPKVIEIFNELEIPENHYSLNLMALGVPAQKIEAEESSEEINIIE